MCPSSSSKAASSLHCSLQESLSWKRENDKQPSYVFAEAVLRSAIYCLLRSAKLLPLARVLSLNGFPRGCALPLEVLPWLLSVDAHPGQVPNPVALALVNLRERHHASQRPLGLK